MKGMRRFGSRAADTLPLYLFVFALMLMGVLFGVLLVNSLTLEQKQDLFQFTGGFLQSLAHGGPASKGASSEGWTAASFAASLWDNLRWIGLMWLFGLSVIGVPLVLLLDFLKGVLIGFSVGYFVGEFAWRGAGFALAAIVPHNLVFVPALIVTSAAALSFSAAVIRGRLFRKTVRSPLAARLARFSGVTMLMAGCAALAAFLETRVSPVLLDWMLPWLLEGNVTVPSIFTASIL